MVTPEDFMVQVYRYFMTAVSPQEQQAAAVENRTPMTVVEQLVAADLLGSDASWSHYVFRGNEDDALPVLMESSGSAGVLLVHGGFWALQNRHNTMQFPKILVGMFADTTRDDNAIPTNTTAKTGKDRVLQMYNIINPIFHDPTNTIHKFGDIPIAYTFSSDLPQVDLVPGSDGLYRLLAQYEVTL